MNICTELIRVGLIKIRIESSGYLAGLLKAAGYASMMAYAIHF